MPPRSGLLIYGVIAYTQITYGANGATTITNLVTNPSLEVSGVWGTANGATCTRQAASAIVRSWGLSCSTTNTADSGAIIPHSITFQAGQTYTASVSIHALTAGSYSLSPQVDVDGGMIVQGTNGVYADGGTSGWAWDGATGLSTSSGTPL